MLNRHLLAVLLAFVPAAGWTADNSPDGSDAGHEDPGSILVQLSQKEGEVLGNYLYFLHHEFDTSSLSDQELDLVIERLVEIQESDLYQTHVRFKGPDRLFYPNRKAAKSCIFRLQFQKIANRLRALPMEDRIAEIVEGMANPPRLAYDTTTSFSRELVAAGKDGVPYIIQYRPEQPYYRRQIVEALAEIGDSRAVPYIVEVLQTDSEDFRFERPIAAEALGVFDGEEVIQALITALKDETYQEIDRDSPQQEPASGHEPRIGRYYSVQHKASQSLSRITGHDWGLVYNEDFTTWTAWHNTDNKDAFDPRTLDRTLEEKEALVESLFHRYMSARPNPWQPQNALATPEGVEAIAQDLKPLGTSVELMLLETCYKRITATPIWRDELQEWTKKLVLASRGTKPPKLPGDAR